MIKETGLDVKVGGAGAPLDVKFEKFPVGKYVAKLVRVYPWRSITKDTKVSLRDEDNKVIKDANGKPVKELVKDVTWHNADLVFEVTDGAYKGYAIKGSLSTHPEMLRSLKQFLYCSSLFGVAAGDIKDHIGAEVGVKTKEDTRTYTDKDTGVEKTVTDIVAHWYIKPEEIEEEPEYDIE